MTKIDEFKGSNAWSNEYALPLIPQHLNPFIYSAYIRKICEGFDTDLAIVMLQYRDRCEVQTGLFHRYPGGRGGVTSHDEIMGLAYHSVEAAKDILYYLEKHDGIYINNQMQATLNMRPIMSYNVYRFIFLKPFLKACAGYRVGLVTQLQFSLFLIYDLITHSKKELDPAGRLRIWIMLEAMEKYPLSGIVIAVWRWVMKNKGISPKVCFTHYLAEVPIMKKLAPDYF